MARQLNRNRANPYGGGNLGNYVLDWAASGSPTNGTSGTGVGKAGPGSRYTDIATGKVYVNTGTKASPTWTVIGSVT